MEKFLASDELVNAPLEEFPPLTDRTDVTGIVGIITVDFEESSDIDESTIPADTATFANKTSTTAPVQTVTPETGGQSLVWPEPAGGWNFTSLQASPSGNAYGYRVTATGGNFLGCKKFPLPIPIDGIDQHIVIGTVRLPLNVGRIFLVDPNEESTEE